VKKSILLLIPVFVFFMPQVIFGKVLLDFATEEHPDADTTIYDFDFSVSENRNRIVLDLDSQLEQGRLTVWVGGGGYEVIGNYSDVGRFTYDNLIFGPLDNTEPIYIRITAENAVGNWHITFTEISSSKSLISIVISGILMIVISTLFMITWKTRSGVALKWILLGGGIWAIGVFLKFVFAFLLNAPILEWFQYVFGKTGYLLVGSVYIGVLTGVFEIGITLVFALFIKGMYENHRRGIGIGIGAGGFEALILGFSQIGNTILILSGHAGGDALMTAIAQASASTPLLWLIGPVERVIAILCHTSSRALVLIGVAKKRYIYFWAGFLIMTTIDAIAGYVHLADLLNKISMWWIELALLPFALISIPVIMWCVKNWNTRIQQHNNSQHLC